MEETRESLMGKVGDSCRERSCLGRWRPSSKEVKVIIMREEICDFGLENWPSQGNLDRSSMPYIVLINFEAYFQVGNDYTMSFTIFHFIGGD